MFKVNLHFFFLFLAFGFVESFGPVYFYKIGLSLSDIALYWALFFAIRIIVRPFLMDFCHYFGIKRLFLISIILFSGRYLFYASITGPGPLMVALLLYEATASTAYWAMYHTYFAILSSTEKAGTQVANRDIMLLSARLLAPFCSSLIVDNLGFRSAFFAAGALSLVSVFPLINKKFEAATFPKFSWKKALKTDRSGFFLYGPAGIHEYAHTFLWRIALFLQVSDYVGFGFLLSLSILFQMIGTAVVGRHFDRTRGTKVATTGISILAVVLLSRATLPLSIPLIIALDFIFMLGQIMQSPYVSAINYKRSKASGNPLWFQFWSETGWDLACIMTLGTASVLMAQGVEIRSVMLIGLIGLLGIKFAIRQYR